MKLKELIYRRAVLIAELYITDAEMDAIWRQDQSIAWRWFDQLWEQRRHDFVNEMKIVIKNREEVLAELRPKVIETLAASGGWKAKKDYYLKEATAEADRYRIKSIKEIKEFWEKKYTKK